MPEPISYTPANDAEADILEMVTDELQRAFEAQEADDRPHSYDEYAADVIRNLNYHMTPGHQVVEDL